MASRIGLIRAVLNLDSAGFRQGLERAQSAAATFRKKMRRMEYRMKRFGRKMENVGRSMTMGITVPVAAAGGAIVKMSSDFESSLAEARAQADLTAEQVSFIGDSAKDTARRTGESTDSIIEAYKFAVSAGMNLANSQNIVGAAAEAAAAGFGEQKDLVRLTTTAMQAYNAEIDSGRQFMDLLVGAAQVMELEVSKLGPAMQRNVGVAKVLGVGLSELLAGIGSVSEIMGDAQRGGRMFQTMLAKLLQPSAEATANIVDTYGSLETFHKTIRDDGLLQTMVELRQRLEEAGMGMEAVFTGQRGLEAALNLTNRAGARTAEIMEKMGDTAGSTKSAFDDVSDTTERRFKQALQNVKVAAIEFGEIMLPVANKVITAVTNIAEAFTDMSDESRKRLLKVAGILAVSGPVVFAIGKFVGILSSMLTVFRKVMVGMATIAMSAMGRIGAAFIIGLAVGQHFVNNMKALFSGNFDEMNDIFSGWADAAVESVQKVFGPIVDLGDKAFSKLAEGIGEVTGTKGALKDFYKLFEEKSKDATDVVKEQTKAIKEMIKATSGGRVSLQAPTVGNLGQIQETPLSGMKAKITEQGKEISKVTKVALAGSVEAFNEMQQKIQQQAESFARTMEGVMENAITSFASSIGKLASGAASLKDVAVGLINILSDMMIQIGSLWVAFGTGWAAAMNPATLFASGGTSAIVAGAGLIAAGAALKSIFDDAPEMAEGGLAFGPTMAVVGDNPNAKSNPEVIAPLDKLQGMIGGKQKIINIIKLDGKEIFRNQKEVKNAIDR